jgi:predicted Zn-dependent protease
MNILEKTTDLGTYLNEREDVTQWQISATEMNRREIYLIGEKIEQLRAVEDRDFKVTIFCDKEENGDLKRGSALACLSEEEAASPALRDAIISDAVYAAGLGLNTHFTLDDFKTNDRELLSCDFEAVKLPTETVENIAKRTIEAVRKEKDVYLAAAEAFVSHNKRVRSNSNGLFHEDETSLCTYELAVGSEIDSDVETQCLLKERFLKNLPIEEIVSRYAGYCRDNTIATLPPSGIGKIIFTDESFESLFDYFKSQSNGAS